MKPKKSTTNKIALIGILSLAVLIFTNSNVFGQCPCMGNPTITGSVTPSNNEEAVCAVYDIVFDNIM